MAPYDIVGSICIAKFARGTSKAAKIKWAKSFLKEHVHIQTVVEKSGRIKGRLRTPKTRWIAGVKTREALHKENGCEFRLNIDTCYFSPRLSAERKEIASVVRNGERVLVMFGGVGVFAVIIAKLKKDCEVFSIELGRDPHKYALENAKRNKANVTCLQGDVRRVVPKLKSDFDRIVMARPNLQDSFLDVAFRKIKRGGVIHYYGFYPESEIGKLNELINEEARKARKKIKIFGVKKAGDIGNRRYRYRADIKVKN